MEWDGSYLGSFSKDIIRDHIYFHRIKVVRLRIKKKKYIGFIRQVKSKILCIYDELKPIFGIPKMGTHSLHISGKLYIICHVHHHNNIVDIGERAYDRKDKDIYSKDIRRNIIYNDIFLMNSNLSRMFIKNIKCNIEGLAWKSISDYSLYSWPKIEPYIDYRGSTIAGNFFKYLDNDNLLPIVNIDTLMAKVEEKIYIIDSSLIYWSSVIKERISIYQ
jgi:hypothetical protein